MPHISKAEMQHALLENFTPQEMPQDEGVIFDIVEDEDGNKYYAIPVALVDEATTARGRSGAVRGAKYAAAGVLGGALGVGAMAAKRGLVKKHTRKKYGAHGDVAKFKAAKEQAGALNTRKERSAAKDAARTQALTDIQKKVQAKRPGISDKKAARSAKRTLHGGAFGT